MSGVVWPYFDGTLEHTVGRFSVSICINFYQAVCMYLSFSMDVDVDVNVDVNVDVDVDVDVNVEVDVNRDIFVDVDVSILFYGMEIHIYSLHCYDVFGQQCFHCNLYGFWWAYGIRCVCFMCVIIL